MANGGVRYSRTQELEHSRRIHDRLPIEAQPPAQVNVSDPDSSRGISFKCKLPCSLLGQVAGFSPAPSTDTPKRIFGSRFDHHSCHLTLAVTEDGRKTNSSRLVHSVNVSPVDFWHVRRWRVSILGESII